MVLAHRLNTSLNMVSLMFSTDTIEGALLGTALGDGIGLPFEGLPPHRVARRLERRRLGHSMIARRGLLSDDTEHAAIVARALAESLGAVAVYASSLARQLRRWILGGPPGVGLATLRGCIRLLLGWSPSRSGVNSAGNGPAMRAALVGLCAKDDAHLRALVRITTRVTHTDPRAEDAALLVARLARCAASSEPISSAIERVEDAELRARVTRAAQAADAGVSLDSFREDFGAQRGVTGFVLHTMPAAVFCWARHRGDPRGTISAAVRLGGDTDTVAAIAGSCVGSEVGASGLPRDWIDGLSDWPLSVYELRRLAKALAHGDTPPPQRWIAALPRNLMLVPIILGHLMLRAAGR